MNTRQMKKTYGGRSYTTRPTTVDDIELGTPYCINGITGYVDGLNDDVIWLVDEAEKEHEIKLSEISGLLELVSDTQLKEEEARANNSLLSYNSHGYIMVHSYEERLLPLTDILKFAGISLSAIRGYRAVNSFNIKSGVFKFDRTVYYLKQN